MFVRLTTLFNSSILIKKDTQIYKRTTTFISNKQWQTFAEGSISFAIKNTSYIFNHSHNVIKNMRYNFKSQIYTQDKIFEEAQKWALPHHK